MADMKIVGTEGLLRSPWKYPRKVLIRFLILKKKNLEVKKLLISRLISKCWKRNCLLPMIGEEYLMLPKGDDGVPDGHAESTNKKG
ncbi:hypothetical protein CEXT_57861 [Caerostris extrusa]|uniref:Uncharacterized protein n=1 Tax=Caerostris extrusa TaxID=172846 RepID=A0AAV4PKB1_CAEEX|nr:hypothetical protein CEXT_57861 [Caerostris extrusa]